MTIILRMIHAVRGVDLLMVLWLCLHLIPFLLFRCRYARYCSGQWDVDGFFGSLGPFHLFEPLEGTTQRDACTPANVHACICVGMVDPRLMYVGPMRFHSIPFRAGAFIAHPPAVPEVVEVAIKVRLKAWRICEGPESTGDQFTCDG